MSDSNQNVEITCTLRFIHQNVAENKSKITYICS